MNVKYCFRFAILFMAFSFLFSVTGCKSKEEKKKVPPSLKVMQIKGTVVPRYLELVGQAVGIPTVNITARVEGYLQNWSFTEGSLVNKGQLLFTIEQDRYINDVNFTQADLESKKAAWEKAKLDVARLKPLLTVNAISQNDYDVAVTTELQTRAAVESAEANLADAKLSLSYTTITSPITGMIGKVNVNPGNLVGRGEPTLLTTVSSVNPIYVDFQMNENDYLLIMRIVAENKWSLDDLKKELKVFLTLSDKREYAHPGAIDFIDRAVNPLTGTLAMRAVVPNPEGIIKPGNFATINLLLGEEEQGIILPQSAITQIQGKFFAFVVNDSNKVNRVPITIGRNIGSNVRVLQGVGINDRILLEGFQKFQEGMHVTPVMVADTLSARINSK